MTPTTQPASPLASIDIGTNSVLCLIARPSGEGVSSPLKIIEDLADITRLGEGLNQSDTLNPQAQERTIKVLKTYVQKIQHHGVRPHHVFTLATAGMRRAKNSREFIQRVKTETGLAIEIIDGKREAHLSFLAVSFGLANQFETHRPFLIMDIGGGSTEIVRSSGMGTEKELQQVCSLPIGSVWLTEKFLIDKNPPSSESLHALSKEIRKILQGSSINWKDQPSIIGIAGTLTTLAAIEQRLEIYEATKVHGTTLSQKQIQSIFETVCALPLEERRRLPGLDPRRADVILAGTAIALEVLKLAETDHLIVSDQGVRYGVLYEHLDH